MTMVLTDNNVISTTTAVLSDCVPNSYLSGILVTGDMPHWWTSGPNTGKLAGTLYLWKTSTGMVVCFHRDNGYQVVVTPSQEPVKQLLLFHYLDKCLLLDTMVINAINPFQNSNS